MEIYFRTRKLKKSCSSEKKMRKDFGLKMAAKIAARLNELSVAENLDEVSRVPPARCHELSGDREGQLSVDLQHPQRLIFIPANDPVPLKEDGGLDWEKVDEVEIIEIVDPH